MLLSEEQIQKLKEAGVRYPDVNETCIGCSACVAISGDVFDLNDEGKSVVIDLPSYENLGVDDSIMACPVNAISWKN
nr:ferredoxin [Candidatus Gracilibacteria bacterium]